MAKKKKGGKKGKGKKGKKGKSAAKKFDQVRPARAGAMLRPSN